MPKTADFIAEQQSQAKSSEQAPAQVKKKRRLPEAMVAWQWKKGQSGNPGGRPKYDFSAAFARKVLEAQGNEAVLTDYANGFCEQLRKGNAYTFKELAERGYGKLKETKEQHNYNHDVSDGDLQERIDGILRDLGLAAQVDDAGGAEGTQGGAGKTNGHAQVADVLPGNGAAKA